MSSSQHLSDARARSHAPRVEFRARDARSRRGPLVRRALICADALAILAAAVVAHVVGGGDLDVAFLALVGLIPLWIVGAKAAGLYSRDERHADHTTVDELWPLVHLVTLGTWLGFFGSWAVGRALPTSATVSFWGVAILALLAGRVVARTIVRRFPAYLQNTLIVGAGDVGQLVGRKLRQHPEFCMNLIGFVDTQPKAIRTDLDGIPIVGSPDRIVELVRAHDVQRVIVAFSNDRHDLQLELIRALRDMDVQIDLVPRLFEAVGPAVGMHAVEGLPLVGLQPMRASRVAVATKRVLEVTVSAAALLLLSPFFLFVALRIRSTSPGPVFFRQERLGRGMRPFTMLKFRTMAVDTDDGPHREYVESIMDPHVAPAGTNLYKLERAEAVTKVGVWLRRTSLDELPQLLNVLRGDMSLVGPRPCIAYEISLFEPHHFDRFLVPAGMTGLWQVSARANSTFREALDLDAAYARNWSLGLDLRLLARTPLAVLRGKDSTT